MTLPNFLIIGTGKSGTSSLYYYLMQHPEVYMSPVKEPNFLGFDPEHKGWNGPITQIPARVNSLAEYLKLFEQVRNEKAIGEASPSTFTEFGCSQVQRYMPQARLICILRQPVDAAYSAFLHRRRDGCEPESDFLKAYRATESRKKQNWSPMMIYRRMYSYPLKNWLSHFPREQFRFYLTDDLKQNASGLIGDLYRFLEVDDTFRPDLEKRNPAYQTRIQALRSLLNSDAGGSAVAGVLKRIVPTPVRSPLKKKLIRWNQAPAVLLDPKIRNELTSEMRDEILCVQDLIGRDLSHWLKEK